MQTRLLCRPTPHFPTWANCNFQSSDKSLILELTEYRSEDPDALDKDLNDSLRTNVIGNINLFNLFVPLLQKGNVKKAISISTGLADLDGAKVNEIGAPYSISKAALNLAVAKFSAQYGKEGILFMSISPGLVNTKPESEGQYSCPYANTTC